MIVENAIASKEAIRLPVNAHELSGESLGAAVGRSWPQWRLFALWRFFCAPENFRARGVVKAHRLRLIARNLEQAQRRHSNFFASRFRNFETQTDMALSGEVINFRGTHFGKNPPQSRAIGKIPVMQKKAFLVDIFVAPQMLNARAEQVAGSPNDPVNLVTFLQQQLGQIGSILTGDAGNQCCLFLLRHRRSHLSPECRGRTRLE